MQMNQKLLQSEQTKSHIIKESSILFSKKGFHATSISDLAKATNLTKGAIYHHFENKDELFLAVLQSIREYWRKEILRDILQIDSAIGRIKKLIENHINCVLNNDCICTMFIKSVINIDNLNDNFKRVIQDTYEDLEMFVEHIIKKGQKRKEIKLELDPEFTSLSIIAALDGGIIPMMASKEEVSYKMLMNTMEKLIIDGLSK